MRSWCVSGRKAGRNTSGGRVSSRRPEDVLRGYAYSGREYSFIEILEEPDKAQVPTQEKKSGRFPMSIKRTLKTGMFPLAAFVLWAALINHVPPGHIGVAYNASNSPDHRPGKTRLVCDVAVHVCHAYRHKADARDGHVAREHHE